MKEINKLKFKRAMLLGSLMLGLTGCSINSMENRQDRHAIVTMGDKTIIFRSCDENYDIKVIYDRSAVSIHVYDTNDNVKYFNSKYALSYDGNDQAMLEIEEDLLKNGAYLYQLK